MPDKIHSEIAIHYHRSLFLSDLHLGAVGSRADLLLTFLKHNVAQCYVLVGDIIQSGDPFLSQWTEFDQAIINHLCDRKSAGAELIYVRGNHDPESNGVPSGQFLPVFAVEQVEHLTANGSKYLVIHGDSEDTKLYQLAFLTQLGSFLDSGLRTVDRFFGRYVYDAGSRRRSLIEAVLAVVNWGLYPTRSHERRLVSLARANNCDGVICGHFHQAELHERHGLIYANCGDWMDSFTALAEDQTGRLQMLGGRNCAKNATVPGFALIGAST